MKFGHGTTQCKSQIVKPLDRILEVVPASVDQTVSNRTLATSRQRSSLRVPPQPLEGADLASNEDLKKIASSEIPNPAVSSSNSFDILLKADSSVNQTKKMPSSNDGRHNIDKGSKRNSAD
ncbi:hypothetical protein Nepgr_025443 [Nepenthes gracilis]|uniref:Uncharacterized protein n=1 Tax=Nepenthes gracilis TaxID=150966 RepID=A0AAD3T541_NEPGR|nr:hypothetical protein Nepgr_025443 [Nepenthes gracilis]